EKIRELHGDLGQSETIFAWLLTRKRKGLEVAHILELVEKAEEEAVEKLDYDREVVRLLRELKVKDVKLAIVSMQGEKTLRKALKLMGIEEVFDQIVSRDFSLSREEQLMEVLAKWKIKPQEAIFMSDRVDDINLGRRLGLKAFRAKASDGGIIKVLEKLVGKRQERKT
ncbi:MAG: hypothetical protein DRJ98_06770, partial [Thermoprotei archaeon]